MKRNNFKINVIKHRAKHISIPGNRQTFKQLIQYNTQHKIRIHEIIEIERMPNGNR